MTARVRPVNQFRARALPRNPPGFLLVVQTWPLVVFRLSPMQTLPELRILPAAVAGTISDRQTGPRSGRSRLSFRICASLLLLISVGSVACKKKPVPPTAEVIQQYQAQADRLCRAVVDCIKADTAKRLAGQPQHRDMVLSRMGQDLCLKNQYQLIGSLSTEPLGPGPAQSDSELYERYGRCVTAVESATDCETRRERYFTHPDCRGLRDQNPEA